MGEEDTGALSSPDETDLLIVLVHTHGAPGARDRRDQILLEAFFEVHHIAREYDSASFREPYHGELATGREARSAHNLDALIAEQVKITIEADDVVLLAVSKVPWNVVDSITRVRPPRGLQLIVLDDKRGVWELRHVPSVVEVHVPQDNVFDVLNLHADLRELRVHRVVLGHLQAKTFG